VSPFSLIRERKPSSETSSYEYISSGKTSPPNEALTHKLVFAASDVGNIHVVGGWAKILQFLPSKDVDCDEMDFGVAVLSSL